MMKIICTTFILFLTSNLFCQYPFDYSDLNLEEKTTDFIPKINDYDFYIEGEIDNRLIRYEQYHQDYLNVSNTYFVESKQTWLQAYSDSTSGTGFWFIRFYKVDIENIELPYTLKEDEGAIEWFDARVDLIHDITKFCNGYEGECCYQLRPKTGSITITKVDDSSIEGNFSGQATMLRTGFVTGQNESLYHNLENGYFKMEYQKDKPDNGK